MEDGESGGRVGERRGKGVRGRRERGGQGGKRVRG